MTSNIQETIDFYWWFFIAVAFLAVASVHVSRYLERRRVRRLKQRLARHWRDFGEGV